MGGETAVRDCGLRRGGGAGGVRSHVGRADDTQAVVEMETEAQPVGLFGPLCDPSRAVMPVILDK